MDRKRLRFVLRIAAIVALLAALLPMQFSIAMQNSQTGKPECLPIDASMLKAPGFIKSLPAECRGRNALGQMSFPQSMLVMTVGGPDDFGYTFDDTVPFNWISATNASGVTGDESVSGPFDIGFSFPFYGFNYSQLFIHTNGFLTFDPIDGCCFYEALPIPYPGPPNNFIAPFWDDLVVGDPFNSGAIYYERGGVAPDRYLVVEWRDVTTYLGSDPFSFEVILYENGNILAQLQSLPAGYYSTIGIENNAGDDGSRYHFGNAPLSAPKAILFSHPTGPIARVSVSPRNTGRFASTSSSTNFPITVSNPGSAGTDTYNVSIASSWFVNLYQDGCVTPLTDTNADTIVDTGPLPEGSSTTICVSFVTLAGASVGASNSASMIVTSSLDPGEAEDVTLNMVIPTRFVHVFEDYIGAEVAFQIVGPEGSSTRFLTDEFYFANGLAITHMPDGRYIYAWRKPDGNFPDSHSNIEFALLNADGSFDLPVTQLTNNVGTGQTYDYDPAVAVTPNGNIGITWLRWIVDNNTGMSNYNIYFAVLDDTGTLLSGPTNLTNNDLYDNFDNLDVPHTVEPGIAGTDDNRFVLSWQDFRLDGVGTFSTDIWYTTRDSNGANIFAPVSLTTDNDSQRPILNPLSGGNVILTYESVVFSPAVQIDATYAVIAGSGAIVKDATPIDSGTSGGPLGSDAVHLPNGNTAIALAQGSEVALIILDPSYNIIAGPTVATTSVESNFYMSVTYDTSNNIIMTWLDAALSDGSSTNLFYALADPTGLFITSPIIVGNSPAGLITSINGQGNAPFLPADDVMEVDIDIVPGSSVNAVSSKTPYVPVAILSADGFDAVSDVDRSSLTFGKTGEEDSLFMCLSKARDVNGDGRRDLICLFRFSMTGIAAGDTQAVLRGQTLAGTGFEGTDSVQVGSTPTK